MTGTKSNKKKKKVSARTASKSEQELSEASKAAQEDVELSVENSQEVIHKQAMDLKDKGNKLFSGNKFQDALVAYSSALKLLDEGHKDRAIIHSNRAACLLQMAPVKYELVLVECNKALAIQPDYQKALLRRARTFIALKNYELALQDLNFCLKLNPENKEAMDNLVKLQLKKVGDTRSSFLYSRSIETGNPQHTKYDEWYLRLANLIQAKLGFDPLTNHMEDEELEAITQAVEETTCMEEAIPLLEAAEGKFRSVSALVLLNWGSVHRTLAEREKKKKDQQNKIEKAEGVSEVSLEKDEAISGDVINVSDLLEECNWSLNHLDLAVEKFTQALELQSDLVDAQIGRANAYSHRARVLERNAALQIHVEKSVARTDLEEIYETYEKAADEFRVCYEYMENFQKNFEAHSASCSDPHHSHSHGNEGGNARVIAMTNSYKNNITASWTDVLASFSHFKFKLGVNDWETTLKTAKVMEDSLRDSDFADDYLGRLPEKMLRVLGVSENGERKNADEITGEEKGEWEQIWSQASAVKEEAEETIIVNPPKAEEVTIKEVSTEVPEINVGVVDKKEKLAAKLSTITSADEDGGKTASETDEPMTPVADLVGKFLSLAKAKAKAAGH